MNQQEQTLRDQVERKLKEIHLQNCGVCRAKNRTATATDFWKQTLELELYMQPTIPKP